MSTHPREHTKAFLVGGGIASLAAAAYLIRDAKVPGPNIVVLEESGLGGSLDAGGSAERGYSMRGSRMYGAAYVHTAELFAGIPSLDDPAKSATQDMLEFWQEASWDARARLVEHRRIVDASDFALSNRDRADLIGLMLRPEDALGARRIDECFEPHFLESNFWFMWCSMFGFQPWHSAAEFRRYLVRFLRLFPDLPTMHTILSTRYNNYDSLVRPLLRWLTDRGVRFDVGVQVTDLDFAPAAGGQAVRRIRCLRNGAQETIDVDETDVVVVTLGSMTADASLGSMTSAPAPSVRPSGGSWALWRRLAARDPAFGRPDVFCGHVERTQWVTFTVTDAGGRFFERMERFSGSPAGRGGLVTLKTSNWQVTLHLYHPPAYAGQPEARFVWWGYGMFADRPGNYVPKAMPECTGTDLLVEVFSHLGFEDDLPALLAASNCIPCLLPYTTSQLMPRSPGDRPDVVPPGAVNFAFVGQYCEIPDNVVYTVEYSVHAARIAVSTLLRLPGALPPTYKGLEHPNALVGAMRRILQ